MNPSLCWAGLWCAFAVLLSSCKGGKEGADDARVRNENWPGYFVSARWVAQRQEGLRLIDVRSRSEYELGHLAGAVNLPLALWHEDLMGRTDRMVPAAQLQRFLSEAGVTPDDRVVCYGAAGELGPARAAWVLGAYGHERVAVMVEGLQGWADEGGALTSEVPEPTPTVYPARLCGDRVANSLSVLHGISDGGVTLLDARRGVGDGTGRQGRIPNSLSLELNGTAMQVVSHEGMQVLRDALQGFRGEEERYVVYSDDGMRASLVCLVLRDLGAQAELYDGGWNEWASHPNLPIERIGLPAQPEAPAESSL